LSGGPTAADLATFTEADLAAVEPWFADGNIRRFLGGPYWPAAMLEHADRAVGTEFRGALQTGARRYLARIGARPVGYIELFEAGVEPDNTASRRCLQAAGFELRTPRPDFEGMLYYQLARAQR
jgi:hypothetical protein